MEFNLTVTISVIIALVALISPIAVAIINNCYHERLREMELQHDLQVKQMDLYYSEKKQAFDLFLQNAGSYRFIPSQRKLDDLQSSAYSAILFCKEENMQEISDFLSFANEQYSITSNPSKMNEYNRLLFSLASSFNKELLEMKDCYTNYQSKK